MYMKRGLTGKWIPQSIQGRDYEAFLPNALPPTPTIEWSNQIVDALSKAIGSVARLDGAARLLPDLHLFIYSYIRKEAVLSSQIEGTQSSLSDLLMFETEAAPGVPLDDVTEVVRYVEAIDNGVKRILAGEDISLSFILDLHKTLLTTGRGSNKDPGKLRETQNWIGGASPDRAKFVPPPPERVSECLIELLTYWQQSKDHTLIKAALIHLQFETIHPFRDGNGRIGRLLITLLLCQEKLIAEPMVYLSLYFKANRDEYYEKLQSVRTNGNWEDWVVFFLKGITEVTESAFAMTQNIQNLFKTDLKIIRENGGRKLVGMLEVYRAAQESPIFTVPKAERLLHGSISRPTIYTATAELVKLGILSAIENESSDTKAYAYSKYIALLR